MKTIKKLSILIIIFCTLSCSNDNSSNEDETKATVKDIYVCGYEKRSNNGKLIATVWKNGVITSLTDGTNDAVAKDVAVSGNDVYVVGYEEDSNGNQVARFWKNGVPVKLVDTPGSVANLITVSGNDVFIIGRVSENNTYVRKIWKNGVASVSQGDILSIKIKNNDIYTVGIENEDAKVWKNAVATSLTKGNTYSAAYDVEIKGNDVYVVGVEMVGNISVARLWKNGAIVINLTDGKFYSGANAISISDNDIYVSGYEENSKYTSKIWKNGEVIWTKENLITVDLKVVGQDIYLLSNSDGAKILKNGLPENLSSALRSNANALFITTN